MHNIFNDFNYVNGINQLFVYFIVVFIFHFTCRDFGLLISSMSNFLKN